MREKLAKKKTGAGEFQGATRSSGPENEMLVGSLRVSFVRSSMSEKRRRKKKARRECQQKKREREEKSNLFIISRHYIKINTTTYMNVRIIIYTKSKKETQFWECGIKIYIIRLNRKK